MKAYIGRNKMGDDYYIVSLYPLKKVHHVYETMGWVWCKKGGKWIHQTRRGPFIQEEWVPRYNEVLRVHPKDWNGPILKVGTKIRGEITCHR